MGTEQKNLSEILLEQLRNKNWEVEKLSSLTFVPDRYVNALMEGDFKKLPAAPYIRGYLIKIAPFLDLDAKVLWEAYKREQDIKSSGAEDRLPSNRFAIKPVNKKMIMTIMSGVFVAAYLFWNVGHLLGQPKLEVVYPLSQTAIVSQQTINLLGYINPIDKLFINNEEIIVRKDGSFEKDYNLDLGLNRIEFSVKRFLGKETKAVKQIIYQPGN